jgi:hypothetical protein
MKAGLATPMTIAESSLKPILQILKKNAKINIIFTSTKISLKNLLPTLELFLIDEQCF